MARWRLTKEHYLNVPGTEWEYKETDQASGRTGRKIFNVPRYLDPEDPRDWTDKTEGEIVVCHEGKGHPKDIVFVGPPTMDMEPLDAEAEKITDSWRDKWIHPIDSLPAIDNLSALPASERQPHKQGKSGG